MYDLKAGIRARYLRIASIQQRLRTIEAERAHLLGTMRDLEEQISDMKKEKEPACCEISTEL